MSKIEQVREALEAAKHAMTNQRYLLPRLGMEDAHAKVTSAIAILKDMDGQEPVAKDAMPTYDAGLLSNYGGGDVEWWQDYIRAELNRADDFYQSWWQSAHPSPSAPVDIAEIIAAGKLVVKAANEMERTLEAMDDGQFTVERDNYKNARRILTTATAKRRTP